MRKALWSILFVVALLAAVPARAQNPNYDTEQVWRVTYYHIKPGQAEAFWKTFRENLKPIYESLKKEGLLSDYKIWTNVTVEHPDDWDVALGLMFANYAALDQLDAKAAPASLNTTIARRHDRSWKKSAMTSAKWWPASSPVK
jgi:hypothetical protein